MKDRIRQRARELGFDDCRFTTAQPPDHAASFRHWLAEKHHGEMAYLERNAHKRANPREVLPGARSLILLAASYWIDVESLGPDDRPTPVSGVVARYARFSDYHSVLSQRLRLLADWVNALGDDATRSLWYVDTGPLLERDLAQRAGLGFVGKHTNLISRQWGNWLFLAEIITTLELEPDAPEKNRCGTCVRCLAACPTGAITAPFQLDARRCISYLTIELKGAIPIELRPAIGNRIFGCDDCLEVCPWNRFARAGRLMKENSRPTLATPDLLELLALDEAGFKRRFTGTPLLRAKRRGLLRNVCVALGNTGGQTAVKPLQRVAEDTDTMLAEHARWAIEQIRIRGV